MASRSLKTDEILHLLDEIDTDIDEDTDIEPDDWEPTETIHIVIRLDVQAEEEPIMIVLNEQAEIMPTDAASETPVIGTSGFYRHPADVLQPPSGNQNDTLSTDKVVTQDTFDAKNVENMIMKASKKDAPIDMTNPYEKTKVQCLLCKYKLDLDYKNVKLLSQFVSSFTGNVYEKHITGLCQEQQDRLVTAIIRSRNSGKSMSRNSGKSMSRNSGNTYVIKLTNWPWDFNLVFILDKP
ncbi:Ribosomal protein S18 [Trinorchestia longiramus]|nr:Ribosomal protein S18 [Trinorchestia longiramus]